MASPTLDQVTLVRCTPAQAQAAVRNAFVSPLVGSKDMEWALALAGDASDPDVTTWALVPSALPDTLDLLSHCVTYRRTALVGPGQDTAVAYGLGAVHTPPYLRGRGYCRRMVQLLHYVLARGDLPPFPPEWGQQPRRDGFGDATFSFLHSGVGPVFYAKATQGLGQGAREGWVPAPSGTRLWTVPKRPQENTETYEAMSADAVAALQGEYENILRSKLSEGQFAVVPNLSGPSRLEPPSVRGGHFGIKLASGWFTYLKLRLRDQPWRLILSYVHGYVPFAVVAETARREGAEVIEYSGSGCGEWDAHGMQTGQQIALPCYCNYGPEDTQWIMPETLVVEAVGVPGHWAWY